jgi:hypothetical protein
VTHQSQLMSHELRLTNLLAGPLSLEDKVFATVVGFVGSNLGNYYTYFSLLSANFFPVLSQYIGN